MKAHQFFLILSAIYLANTVTPVVSVCLGGVLCVAGIFGMILETEEQSK